VPASITYGSTGLASTTGGTGAGAVSFSDGLSTGCAVNASTGVISVSNASGTCAISASKAGDNNHNPISDGPKTVALNKKALTVTAPTLTILLGQPVPTLSPIYVSSQFVGIDTPASLNTQPTCATTTTVTGVGPYVTRCSGGLDNNYGFTYVDGTLHVNYNFLGFFQPVDMGKMNVAQAGSAIPVKFDLGGNQGLGIFATGYPLARVITCDTSIPSDTIEETVTAGGSSLTYSSGQYIYVWKTDKAWASSCRQLEVKFIDGQLITAKFQFKK